MADEKKFTPREAAIAVLKKAEEMLKSSKHKHIGWDKLHSKLEDEGYSKKSSDKIAGAIKAKVEKTEKKDENEIGTKIQKEELEKKMKISSKHDRNEHLFANDKGTSSMGWKIRSANRAKSWAKDSRSSSPSIERSIAKDKMKEAKNIANKHLAATKAMPKPNLTKAEGEGKKDETMAGDKKAPSNANKPRIEEKPTERDYNDFEPKAGNAPENDHREATQMSPGKNPHEQAEGNNPDWGTDPGVKGHIKLAHFMGHRSAKKKQMSANGIAPAQGAKLERAETGHEKGINTQSDPSQRSRVMMGTSKAGSQLPLSKDPKTRAEDLSDAKNQHKKVLKEMKAQPKPKLTKKENPDEKADAKLGEEVEHLTEKHMLDNKAAEKKEGHKIVKSEPKKMKKGIALS